MEGKEKYINLANTFRGDERGLAMIARGAQGTMPTVSINSPHIPGAWELAMMACWDHGAEVHTHYDKPGDSPSKEATIMVRIEDPFTEPRFSVPGCVGGPEELESYRQEVVYGIHNPWIDPKAGKWKYTYNDRVCNWNPPESKEALLNNQGGMLEKGVDQIDLVTNMLKKDLTCKAAQAVTWYASADPELQGDRPCLQRMWFRALEDKEGQKYLNLNTHWRSRDLAKAWFMNVFCMTDWQRHIAGILSEKIGEEVKVGAYIDVSDSLHIYGNYFKDSELDIEKMKTQPIEGDGAKYFRPRVWDTTTHQAFKMMTEEAKANLAKDPNWYAKGDQDKEK